MCDFTAGVRKAIGKVRGSVNFVKCIGLTFSAMNAPLLRYFTVLIFLAFSFQSQLFAQEPDEGTQEGTNEEGMMEMEVEEEEAPDTTLRVKFGIFANAHAGMTYGSFGDIKDNLAAEQAFSNEEYELAGLGTHYGGQVQFLLFKRLLLSGGGSAFDYDASLSTSQVTLDTANYDQQFETYNRGEATLRTELFHGSVGFAVMNKKQILLFPYAGYCTGTQTLTVKNYSPDILNVGSAPIDRARTEEFESDISLVELGVGVRYMRQKNGGLMVGAELGGYFNTGDNDWTDSDGNVVEDVEPSTLAGGYLRLTVGGGIFSTNEKEMMPEGEAGPDAYDEDAAEEMEMMEEGNSGEMEEESPRERRRRERRERRERRRQEGSNDNDMEEGAAQEGEE